MDTETIRTENFYLIPDTEEITTGYKELFSRYSDAAEKTVYCVYAYYRNIGETEIKTYYKEYTYKKSAEKCYETITESDCIAAKKEGAEEAPEQKIEEEKETEEEQEGAETNIKFYNTIYEYVQDADFSNYEIEDGTIRKTPFTEEIKPANDPDFYIESDCIYRDGKRYRKVNFGEEEESYLLESALYDTVYLRYIEQYEGCYVPENGQCYEEVE